jgi:nucleoside-diphosphate-sugar epimerase
MKYTIFGSSGFIGGHLSNYFVAHGHEVNMPDRNLCFTLANNSKSLNLGHVVYCIGMTANFRTDISGTLESHIILLEKLLKLHKCESITYLSSTRVYEGAAHTHEDASLLVNPSLPGQIYNLSKLTAESMCLLSNTNAKIIRLSNVYGPQNKTKNFLSSVLNEAIEKGAVTFQTSPNSAKDFVSIDDVVKLAHLIITQGKYNIYNLASGENTCNQLISEFLVDQKVKVTYSQGVPEWTFQPIDISRIKNEFGITPERLISNLPKLYNDHAQRFTNGSH